MRRCYYALLCASLTLGTARAEDKNAVAVIDKAIKALGGEAKLAGVNAMTWKAKGKLTIEDNANEFTVQATVRGLDDYRSEFQGEFNGDAIRGVTVVNGEKGWRKIGDFSMKLEGDMLANEKRSIYLQVAPTLLLPLKGKGFQVESAPDRDIDGKPAAVIKATGPDGKEFTLCFDKASGLPVRQEARVLDYQGQEFTQETTISGYKDFDGVKKATKIESKHDGRPFVELEITEFKLLDKIDDDTFAEPK